jgi:small conductance mechanosensitive channel
MMESLLAWLEQNHNLILNYFWQFVVAILIIYVGKAFARFVRKIIVNYMAKQQVDATVVSFTASIIHGLLLAFVFISAISHVGFNTTSLVAIIGAAGLAIGLALQGSLSNFASGVLLILFKPFKAGDFIETAGIAGVVEEILIFSTKLKTGDNKTVIIPNGAITGGTITNYSTKSTRRIDMVIGVSYSADLAKTKQVLTQVVTDHALVLKEPAVTIAVSELADSSINFVVRPWVNSADYWPVKFALLEQIKTSLDAAGIEIPFPQLSVHINQEEQHVQ